MTSSDRNQQEPLARATAWSVHLLTASGAVCGLMALRETAAGRYKRALLWMFAAVLVDAVDGGLARWADVRRRLPEIDGELLDNLVDYLNYVVVPAFLLLHAGLLPPGWALGAAAAICVASALGFSRTSAKTGDHFLTGFPSYWNVLVLYLLLIRPDPRLSLAIVAWLCVMVFVPARYVYPSRTAGFRGLTLVLTVAWAIVVVILLLQYPSPAPMLVYGSLLYPLYYVVVSLMLARQRTQA